MTCKLPKYVRIPWLDRIVMIMDTFRTPYIFDVFEVHKFKIITGINTTSVKKFLEWMKGN
jgi:hypothetical protein